MLARRAGRQAGVEAGQGLVPLAIVATREGSQGMRCWQPGCVCVWACVLPHHGDCLGRCSCEDVQLHIASMSVSCLVPTTPRTPTPRPASLGLPSTTPSAPHRSPMAGWTTVSACGCAGYGGLNVVAWPVCWADDVCGACCALSPRTGVDFYRERRIRHQLNLLGELQAGDMPWGRGRPPKTADVQWQHQRQQSWQPVATGMDELS